VLKTSDSLLLRTNITLSSLGGQEDCPIDQQKHLNHPLQDILLCSGVF
jgi:hypothetical protein